MREQCRQGDIFFEECDAPKKINGKFNSKIIAYGEVTGHAHVVDYPHISSLDSHVDGDNIFIFSKNEDVKIVHDEHAQINLKAGKWWKITRQREYDPLAAERERKVAD